MSCNSKVKTFDPKEEWKLGECDCRLPDLDFLLCDDLLSSKDCLAGFPAEACGHGECYSGSLGFGTFLRLKTLHCPEETSK